MEYEYMRALCQRFFVEPDTVLQKEIEQRGPKENPWPGRFTGGVVGGVYSGELCGGLPSGPWNRQ